MLSAFRKLVNTWPARVLLLLLVASFASWGVADVVRNIGQGSSAVATVQGHDITPQQFMAEYKTGLQRYAEQLGEAGQVPETLRLQVARQTLDRLITQQALSTQVARLGLAVPDSQLRDQVFAMKEFQGVDGKYSRQTMAQVLAANSMSEAHFLDLVRGDIAQNQLLQTVAASAAPSKLLTDLVYRYLYERRAADVLSFPFAGQPLPAPPPESVLRRFYDNHPHDYTAPEYRHVKVAILSPDSIGRSLTVSDADLHAWFDAHKAQYVAPEKRSLEVITAASADAAAKLAAQWKAGASWDAIQAAAKAAGASATPLENATIQEVPSPELARAAFAAAEGAVVGPITEPLGNYVLRVTAVTPAKNPSFDSLRDEVRSKVAGERALDLVDARAQKLQDAFAGGAKIDEVPGELGATGAEGTLDAQGNTPDGAPAPIPAPAGARQQIIDAAFKTNPGDAIQPTEGPDHVWYAVAVDKVVKPQRKPFAEVRDQVLSDWQRDQVRHKQETEAARILNLTKSGQTLAQAAWGSGMQVTRTPPLSRDKPQAGLSAQLVQTLFTLKPNEATMADSGSGFVVMQLAAVVPPDPGADRMGITQTTQGLAQALHDDYLQIYASALRDEAHPVVRGQVVQNLITQPGE